MKYTSKSLWLKCSLECGSTNLAIGEEVAEIKKEKKELRPEQVIQNLGEEDLLWTEVLCKETENESKKKEFIYLDINRS